MMYRSWARPLVGLLMMLSGMMAAATHEEWFVEAGRNSKRSEMPTDQVRVKRQSILIGNDVRQFEVESKIAVRFASTTITSRISNRASSYQPLTFILQLPVNGYIANFSLEANGVTYYGRVRDKCDGEDENTFDASGGLSTGRITALDQNRNAFMVSVSVAPRDTIGVMVNYQELLERIQGWYTQRISINPQQIVRDFRIKAYITEPQGITKVESGILQNSGGSGGIFASRATYTSLDAYIQRTDRSRSRAAVQFLPTTQQQRAIGGDSGINGDFIIRYDIQHDYGVGQVETSDGVFIHHFSPGGLAPIRKSVAFVIDVSASMLGRKLNQTKLALMTILDQMRPEDRFNIIAFSDEVYFWRDDQLVTASSWNINLAKDYVRSLKDLGGTNLNEAMMVGLDQLHAAGGTGHFSATNPGVCILFVLTDGVPSVGVTNELTIEANVQKKNVRRCSVVTVGIESQDHDNFNFLTRLALGNNGVARKIFATSVVSEQLVGVYDEVATPLLVDVVIEYLRNVVDRESLTETSFQNYFNGSEFAISGRLANLLAGTLPVRVTAVSAAGEITIEENVPITNVNHFRNSPEVPPEAAERTAAFIALAHLFNKYTVSDDPQEKKRIVDRTLQLSEQYNLLTPLVSMTFSNTPATTGGGSWRGGTAAVPPSLQWRISGSAYEDPSQDRTYGIGGRICTYEPENVIDLERLHIVSLITDRYARTTVTGEVANRAATRQDVPFTLHIPPGAFISEFTVNVDGVTYTGRVGDIRSTDWQRVFPANGQQLPFVIRRDPTKDTFTARVLGVANGTRVTFDLTYDELLERRQGLFSHRIKLWPGQAVDDLQVDLYLTEPQGISQIALKYDPRTSEGQERTLQVRRSSDYRAHMRYAPSADEQLTYSANGLNGDILLEYDVVHTTDGSYTEVQDDYFVHFFSPTGYRFADKHVVFVIDISSSMVGPKLRQVKEALKVMLDDLRVFIDYFNILVFSDDVRFWKRNGLVLVTPANIATAKRFVDRLIVQGETNLGEAIIQADAMLDLPSGKVPENIHSMMYVLSDGQPTIGITDPGELVRNVTAAINGQHALFCLGFGRNVSFDLLVQLALQNRGSARRIYETTDASEQVSNFYFEVSRPVLFDVEMAYEPGVSNPEDLSVPSFPFYFFDSELSVAGRLQENPSSNVLESSVRGTTAIGEPFRGDSRHDIRISSPELASENTVPDVVQRIWAIKTFQDLISQFAVTKNPVTRQRLADRIASLAIRYNFVTPLTPMSLSGSAQPTGNVPPPSVIHTGTTMDILRRLLEDLPVKPLPTGDPFSVATRSSDGIDTKRLTVNSQIVLRFAMTTISSTMENTGSQAGWAVFKQKIPLEAFITDFTLVLDGKTYHGVADQKSRNVSLQSGSLELANGGGFITELDPESKVFLVSVKLDPGDSADFSLSYQMLLPRRRGMFKHVLGLYPGQVVDHLDVGVSIVEPQGVNTANAYLTDRSQGDSLAHRPQLMTRLSNSKWRVRYQPTRQQQRQLSPQGIRGDFTVEYDVIHANDAGDIQALNDYFVQFFSPSGLSVLRKHVIFVIDISSSMEGTKLAQVKAALKTILDEISPGDKFNILPFSNQVEFLDRYKMVDAEPAHIQQAKSYVDNLQEKDSTNINDAILTGVKMLRKEGEKVRGDNAVVSMLVLLTDGEPTFGEVDKQRIELNVEYAIKGDYSLFCLAFGEDADFEFLNRLALNNHGVARRIPERGDASLLLEGFYDEVATPLLYNLKFYFSGGVVPNTLSQRVFANYFNGSEIVIVGRLDGNRLANHVLRSFVYGKTADREVSLSSDSNTAVPARVLLDPSIPPDLIERIWAYVMVQTLQLKRDRSVDPSERTALQGDITDTSLRYAYLNPYTRMTVSEDRPGVPGGSEAVGLSVWERQLPVDIRDSLTKALTVVPDVVIIPLPDGGSGNFQVHVSLCFDINGGAGDVINLVSDRVKGVYVNAKLITHLVQEHGEQKQETYLGEIGAVLHGDSPNKIRFTPHRIVVNANHTMTWEARSTLRLEGVMVKVDRRAASVTLRRGVEFTVTRVTASRDRPSFLGFYLNGGAESELSTGARGLVGQFRRSDSQISITDRQAGGAATPPCRQQQPVAQGRPVFNEAGRKKVNCWVAAHMEVEDGFIEGQYGQYLVSDMFRGY